MAAFDAACCSDPWIGPAAEHGIDIAKIGAASAAMM
jgi:hypothetical protein